jgi:ATP-binding cassette subfamily C protein
LRGFLGALVAEGRSKLAWVIVIQAAAGLGQAVGILLLVPLLGAVGVTSAGGVGRWTRHIFESLGVRPTLAAVLALYVGVSAASAALTAYQSVLTTRYQLEFADHLRNRVYSAVAQAEWRHLMGLRQSEVLNVLTSSVPLVEFAAYGALNVVVTAIIVFAQLAAAIRVSPAMTGLAVATGAVLLLVVWPLVRRSRRLGAEVIEHNEGVLAMATGFLDGLKLAKAFGRERGHVQAFDDVVAAARGSQVEYQRASATASAIQTTLTALLLGVTVYVGVRLIHVPVSSLLVVAFVFTRMVSQLTSAQLYIQELARGLPAFEHTMRMIATCEAASEVRAGRVGPRLHLEKSLALHDVRFSYPAVQGEPVEALRGVSMELPAGSLIALAGPSGAGKTTIADLVAGLVVPSGGHLTIDGRRLTPDQLLAWRSSVALVPQDPFLFHDTVEANLRWARPEVTSDELWVALRMSNAAGFVERLPGQLQTVVGDRGLRMSGGERQRLALARALLRDPDMLILDEATSSLDTENELAIRTALASLRDRTTILLIAHRLSSLREADQIVVLDAGRVVETGSWEELAQLPVGRLQALIQAGGATVPEQPGAVRA